MKRFLVLLCGIVLIVFAWYRFSLRPVDDNSTARRNITIPSGASVQRIAAILEEEAVIRSPFAFVAHVRLHGQTASLQAGQFILQPSFSVPEIVAALQSGKTEEVSITIPEGYTVAQIDTLMAEKGFTEPGEISRCAKHCDFSYFEFLPAADGLAERGGRIEGYLFPDTYFVAKKDFHPKFFLERLLTTFRHRIVNAYAEDIAASERTLHELVTMASLVEKETRTDDERPMVAGILWKRYDNGQGLGVDATVRYILNKPTAAITRVDLDVDSPYNTRKYAGLPPGPISTVSEKSFTATLEPKQSPYWYYLHAPDGQIYYAETNDEHNRNKQRYLR